MTRPGRYPLLIATDQLPPGRGTGLSRAYVSLAKIVTSHAGAWVGIDSDDVAPSSWRHPLRVSEEVLSAHRNGYCAQTLRTSYLNHGGQTPPQRPEWADAHRTVNRRVARQLADLAAPGATVWIHDYPLQLVPGMLRQLRPDVRVGFSLHHPFPPADILLTLAEHDQIHSSLRTVDLAGFADIRSAANFTGCASTTGAATPPVAVLPLPTETHTIARLAATGTVQAEAANIRTRLAPATRTLLTMGGGEPGDGTLAILGAYRDLLASRRLDPHTTVLIHLDTTDAATANTHTRQDVERLIAQINGTHATVGHQPVQYQRGPFTAAELAAFYLATDVLLAVPTRDRDTPHAAEYAAARGFGTGQLVLSQFSTATCQMPAAAPINPHLPGALDDAIRTAAAHATTRSPQMNSLREQALTNDVTSWANTFLHRLEHTTAKTHAVQPASPHQEGQPHRAKRSDTSSVVVLAPHP